MRWRLRRDSTEDVKAAIVDRLEGDLRRSMRAVAISLLLGGGGVLVRACLGSGEINPSREVL